MSSQPKILALLPGGARHEHCDWLIGPVGHSRDSEPLEESNWQVMLQAYSDADPAGDNYEVHRFGHWAVGWIEEVAVRPGSRCAEVATDLRKRLENYPILDEHHLSDLEHELRVADYE